PPPGAAPLLRGLSVPRDTQRNAFSLIEREARVNLPTVPQVLVLASWHVLLPGARRKLSLPSGREPSFSCAHRLRAGWQRCGILAMVPPPPTATLPRCTGPARWPHSPTL